MGPRKVSLPVGHRRLIALGTAASREPVRVDPAAVSRAEAVVAEAVSTICARSVTTTAASTMSVAAASTHQIESLADLPRVLASPAASVDSIAAIAGSPFTHGPH